MVRYVVKNHDLVDTIWPQMRKTRIASYCFILQDKFTECRPSWSEAEEVSSRLGIPLARGAFIFTEFQF